jgi:serine/threonine-protein kinase RsbW/stage II sporulation protein AB (anti-sigma F factor)
MSVVEETRAQRPGVLWTSVWSAIPESVPQIRHWVLAHARRMGATQPALDAIGLAASEAASNAVLHAFDDEVDAAVMASAVVLLDERVLRVIVVDNGSGMRPRPDSPGLGLGLPLITQLAEDVEFTRGQRGGTQVRMDFALAG